MSERRINERTEGAQNASDAARDFLSEVRWPHQSSRVAIGLHQPLTVADGPEAELLRQVGVEVPFELPSHGKKYFSASLTTEQVEQLRRLPFVKIVEGEVERNTSSSVSPRPAGRPGGRPSGPLPESVQVPAIHMEGAGRGSVHSIGVGASEIAVQLSADQIRDMEAEVSRLRNSGNTQRANELQTTIRALKGELGPEARIGANRRVSELVREQSRSGRTGAAVGIGILVSAALSYYLAEQSSPRSPLRRPR